jgi:hypothetical protein
MYAPIISYNIINLNRQRWTGSESNYLDAVTTANEWEQATGQLHGIEQA